MKDLSYANGWKETPEIVKKCEKLGHKKEFKTIGRCLTEYYCHICDYKYKIDSGD